MALRKRKQRPETDVITIGTNLIVKSSFLYAKNETYFTEVILVIIKG